MIDRPLSPTALTVRDASYYPVLSHEHVLSVVARARSGDQEARDTLIRANLRLAYRIARAFLGRGLDLDDLRCHAVLGLIRAVERYDPAWGCRFGTYASWWIKQAIRRGIDEEGRTVRLPCHILQDLHQGCKAIGHDFRQEARLPPAAEIGRVLGLSDARTAAVVCALSVLGVGRSAFSNGRDRGPLAVPDSRADDPATIAEQRDEAAYRRAWLVRALGELSPRSAQVLVLRAGLDGGGSRTLGAIAATLGITRQAVNVIEVRARDQVARRLRVTLGKADDDD
jgi:RNA polymerase sigma factor (sigma-70 family)